MCSRGLFEAAHKGLTTATVVEKGDTVGYVDHAPGGRTPVVATQAMKLVGWPGLRVPLELGSGGKRVPGHSAKAGTVVREMSAGEGPDAVRAPSPCGTPSQGT
ncbi:hypothetical protein [Streptomyces lunaelactis]|uniref:hypothetical protein n=1 Tax=Streptomyces lunaelactis TaxID=1535768 RepID=UPI00131EDE96|nr:hypothetical protein [Streptomyces lunaelactis]NUK84661.1 hypothetical protein [Streptomyces lunaelactis]